MNALLPWFGAAIATACAVAFACVPLADPMPPPAIAEAATVRGGEAPVVVGAKPWEPTPVVRAGEAGARHEQPAAASAAERFAAIVAALDAGDDGAEQVVALRDLLRAQPELARGFPELVLRPARAERARVRLLQALECVGDAACQASLGAIAVGEAAPAPLRATALRALGGVDRPTEQSLELLWAHANAGSVAARTAVLAFARATAGVVELQPDLHRRCCARLRDELRLATEPCRVRSLLTALASARDPGVAVDAMRCLASPEAAVRATAVGVLLGVPGPSGELAVRDLLCHEPDAEVRRVARRGLAQRAS